MTTLFHRNFEIFKSELHELNTKFGTKFSFTFDAWTASNQDEYMAVTIHYIDKDWKLISRLVGIESIDDTKNAQYLLDIFNHTLRSFDLQDKVQT